MDGGSWFQVAIHDHVADTVLDIVLDSSFQRTSAKLHIVALRRHKLLRLVTQVYVIANLFDAIVESLQFHVDDPLDSLQIELVEGDDFVETVQELRRELLRERFLHDVARMLLVFLVQSQCRAVASTEAYTSSEILQLTRSCIRSHDNHGVAEIHESAVTVSQSSFIEHLQQEVEHIAVSLLDLVEQHDRVGVTPYALAAR